MRFTKSPHRSNHKGRERNTMNGWGLADRSLNRWHGLATILTMMMVGRAPHRFAALHRLFGRGHAAAIGRIGRDRNDKQSQKNSSSKPHPKQARGLRCLESS